MCAGLVSSLGEVPDLSAGGCRVVCKHWAPLAMGSVHQITLEGDGSMVGVHAKVVRRTKVGRRQYSYGLEFINLTPEQRVLIGELSRITGVKRVMPTVDEAARRAG